MQEVIIIHLHLDENPAVYQYHILIKSNLNHCFLYLSNSKEIFSKQLFTTVSRDNIYDYEMFRKSIAIKIITYLVAFPEVIIFPCVSVLAAVNKK